MSDQEWVRATFHGPAPVYFPSLGITASPDDTLSIPAALADELSDVFRVVKADADPAAPPTTAEEKAERRK